MTHNQGWVSVGIDHDTAYFATVSIRRRWEEMGSRRFPRAAELFIAADGGGNDNCRTRSWPVPLHHQNWRGIPATDEQSAMVRLKPAPFHG